MKKSPIKKTNLAKHNDTLDYSSLFACSKKLLEKKGKLSIIIPYQVYDIVNSAAKIEGFYLLRKLIIFPNTKKPANRYCLELGLEKNAVEVSQLTIRSDSNEYTEEYKTLTKDFYTIF